MGTIGRRSKKDMTRDEIWAVTIPCKPGRSLAIPTHNHLVHEEIESVYVHLAHDRLELASPHVPLFGRRSIKAPFAILGV